MRCGVHLLQLDRDYVRVSLRRADLRVTEELLHLAHAGAVLQQMDRAGVTEHMRCDVLLDAGAADRRREDVARNTVDRDAVAEVIDEERACVARRGDAPSLDVALHELRRGPADRHYAILPLCLAG